jgi:hypothetical protein
MSKGKQRKRKRPENAPPCVYCGVAPGITDDHVIPQCFFDKNPSDIVKVPACPACNNNEKSQLDTYLRDIFVTDYRAVQHPVAQLLVNTKVKSAVGKNLSAAMNDAKKNGQWYPLFTKSGVYIDHVFGYSINKRDLEQYLFNITQGLYYKLRHAYLPPATPYIVQEMEGHAFDTMRVKMEALHASGPYLLGTGVFGCYVMVAEEDPATTAWLMWFYNARGFAVQTGELATQDI